MVVQYQKPVVSKLSNLKKTQKGLGGMGKLTDTKTDTTQNYFGVSLRLDGCR